MLGGVDGVVGELPLPRPHAGRPSETAVPHGRAGIPVRLLVEEHLEPVRLQVHFHFAAIKCPALIFCFCFLRQFLDLLLRLADHSAVIGKMKTRIGFRFWMPVAGHSRFSPLHFIRGKLRAAIQGLVFPIVGVDCFHPLLFLLQPCQLQLQLLHSLRVVGADAAPACAADFVQQAPDLLPLLHGSGVRLILFFLFAHREITAPRD